MSFRLKPYNFSSEAGAVLNFFASFFGSSQKMKWGFRGKALVIQFDIKIS
jgi:hypothetical protein